MATIPSACDVAVVGAGPTGLAAALMLQKLGVDAIILEASEQPSLTPRATFIHSRTLEVLEPLGITQDLLDRSNKIDSFVLSSSQKTLTTLDFTALKVKHNYAAVNPQNDTEALFTSKFQSRGGRIFRGIKVTSTKQSDGASHALLSLEDGQGRVQSLRAKYVIGADGLHSPIRESQLIPFEGSHYPMLLLTAELRITSPDRRLLNPSQAKVYMTPNGFALFVPQPTGRWRIYTTINWNSKDEDINSEFYQQIIDEAIGKGVTVDEMMWSANFHISHRLAQRFRSGRILLAGDAAHVHSPAGGQGMNTGIQDGISAAKILKAALMVEERDGDLEACLNQYEQERRPVAQRVVALTHRMTMMATLSNPVLIAIRNMVFKVISYSPWLMGKMTFQLAQYPQLEA